jgi:ABC-type phosphate transport system substrate-binding protein
MRIAHVIFVGSVATLAVLTAPALAKNSTVQKTDDQSTSSSCHAYQQAADGSWTVLPCQEEGSAGQTQHKPVAKSGEEERR